MPTREYRLTHPDRVRESNKKYREAHREELLEKARIFRRQYYKENWDKEKEFRDSHKNTVFEMLGGKCSSCGCDNFKALEIHHIKGGGVKEVRGFNDKGKKIMMITEIYYGRRSTEDLQLLCGVCHKLRDIELLKGLTGWKIIWDGNSNNGCGGRVLDQGGLKK